MRQRFAKQDNIFKRTIFNSKFLTLVVIVIIVLIAQPLIKKINQQRELNKEISALEKEVDRIENKNEDLRGLIDYLDSDSFAEKEARLNLDLRKPGEKVVVVKDLDSNPVVNNETKSVFNIPGLDKEQKITPKTNWQKWRDYFFIPR